MPTTSRQRKRRVILKGDSVETQFRQSLFYNSLEFIRFDRKDKRLTTENLKGKLRTNSSTDKITQNAVGSSSSDTKFKIFFLEMESYSWTP